MENLKTRVSKWLDTESKTGNFLMGDDGPVTRREVLLVHTIVLSILAGAFSTDASALISALYFIAAVLAVRRLNRIDKSSNYGNRRIQRNQRTTEQD